MRNKALPNTDKCSTFGNEVTSFQFILLSFISLKGVLSHQNLLCLSGIHLSFKTGNDKNQLHALKCFA